MRMNRDIMAIVRWIIKGLRNEKDWVCPIRTGELCSELWYLYDTYGSKAIYELAKELGKKGLYSVGYLKPDDIHGVAPAIDIIDISSKEIIMNA